MGGGGRKTFGNTFYFVVCLETQGTLYQSLREENLEEAKYILAAARRKSIKKQEKFVPMPFELELSKVGKLSSKDLRAAAPREGCLWNLELLTH